MFTVLIYFKYVELHLHSVDQVNYKPCILVCVSVRQEHSQALGPSSKTAHDQLPLHVVIERNQAYMVDHFNQIISSLCLRGILALVRGTDILLLRATHTLLYSLVTLSA